MIERTDIASAEMDIRVRYNECDPMNIAHHSVYPVWFEMGRTELLRESGVTYRDLETAGAFLAVVKLQVSFHRPALYDDALKLSTTLAKITSAKIQHDYELRRGRELLTTATTTLACLNRNGQACRIPSVLADIAASPAVVTR